MKAATAMQRAIYDLTEMYAESTGIGCRAFAVTGEEVRNYTTPQVGCRLCDLIQRSENGAKQCRQSHFYGGLQAEKLGEAYIYFCPYGLVNWAVPILEQGQMRYFLIGGPVLMHQIDDLLVKNITDQSATLQKNESTLRTLLAGMAVAGPVRVRHLSELLYLCAKGLMGDQAAGLAERQERNSANARIAETLHELKDNPKDDEAVIYPFEREKELIFRVKIGDQQRAKEILNEILGFVYFHSGNQLEVVRAKAIGLMVLLARAAIEVGADLELIFGLEYTYLCSINEVGDINELSSWLIKVLDRFVECTFSLKNVKNRDLIFKAMNFIRNNHHRDIGLDDVAGEVGLNSAYFSTLFKDEMKITYTDYLNRVRIEAGKQLLEQGLSLADVAQSIGFNDQSYFSKVFKKLTGVSPGRWRRQPH